MGKDQGVQPHSGPGIGQRTQGGLRLENRDLQRESGSGGTPLHPRSRSHRSDDRGSACQREKQKPKEKEEQRQHSEPRYFISKNPFQL